MLSTMDTYILRSWGCICHDRLGERDRPWRPTDGGAAPATRHGLD